MSLKWTIFNWHNVQSIHAISLHQLGAIIHIVSITRELIIPAIKPQIRHRSVLMGRRTARQGSGWSFFHSTPQHIILSRKHSRYRQSLATTGVTGNINHDYNFSSTMSSVKTIHTNGLRDGLICAAPEEAGTLTEDYCCWWFLRFVCWTSFLR